MGGVTFFPKMFLSDFQSVLQRPHSRSQLCQLRVDPCEKALLKLSRSQTSTAVLHIQMLSPVILQSLLFLRDLRHTVTDDRQKQQRIQNSAGHLYLKTIQVEDCNCQ